MTGHCHINPTITIPIVIGSYPILDQPPNYVTIMNGISLPPNTDLDTNANVNANTNAISMNIYTITIPSANGDADANVNEQLNNEQVVRQEPTAPQLDNNKTTDAEPAMPYPQNG